MLEEVRYILPGMMVVMHSEVVSFFNTCNRPGRYVLSGRKVRYAR